MAATKKTNPGNFFNDPARASRAGQMQDASINPGNFRNRPKADRQAAGRSGGKARTKS